MEQGDFASQDYRFLDRTLHKLAFVHPRLQVLISDLERDLFRRYYKDIEIDKPVFITGLPRAGSTLLLEILYGSGDFTSYTYRHMPFLLAPILWSKLSTGLKSAAQSRERAHGDGMSINLDSPEALDEVIWLSFLKNKIVDGDSLLLLDANSVDRSFKSRYRDLIKRILYLANKSRHTSNYLRYLSKNNANIGRLPAVESLFSGGIVLCCFRWPGAHIKSLHTQHSRFLDMHAEDVFAADYMKWIGHHDFGANFKPIRFLAPGAEAVSVDLHRLDQAYWLQYWIDAYRCALKQALPNVYFFSLEDLMRDPASSLEKLANVVDVSNRDALREQAAKVRSGDAIDLNWSGDVLPENATQEAETIYRELTNRCLNNFES